MDRNFLAPKNDRESKNAADVTIEEARSTILSARSCEAMSISETNRQNCPNQGSIVDIKVAKEAWKNPITSPNSSR